MTNSQRLATVRSAIEGYLATQADQPNGLSEIDTVINAESILIRNEYYCGRRFRTTTHRAVWFIDEDQVKIYSADNLLCCVLSAEEIDAVAESYSADDMPRVIAMPMADRGNQSDADIRRAA
jgi:hypothetical protein